MIRRMVDKLRGQASCGPSSVPAQSVLLIKRAISPPAVANAEPGPATLALSALEWSAPDFPATRPFIVGKTDPSVAATQPVIEQYMEQIQQRRGSTHAEMTIADSAQPTLGDFRQDHHSSPQLEVNHRSRLDNRQKDVNGDQHQQQHHCDPDQSAE